MTTHRNSPKYKLIEIGAFDARRGYRRCTLPGVGVYVGRSMAVADFWHDSEGRLVVRLSCQGYTYHFGAALISGKPIPERRMEDFGEYVVEVLSEWLVWGPDEPPPSIYDD